MSVLLIGFVNDDWSTFISPSARSMATTIIGTTLVNILNLRGFVMAVRKIKLFRLTISLLIYLAMARRKANTKDHVGYGSFTDFP